MQPPFRVALLLLALSIVVAVGTPLGTTASVHHVSGKQRQQLLQLKGIVQNALKRVANSRGRSTPGGGRGGGSDIDRVLLPHERGAGNSTIRVSLPFWASRPFLIGGIIGGILLLVLLLIMAFLMSPLYDRVCGKSPEAEPESKKVRFQADNDASEHSKYKDLAMEDSTPYGIVRFLLRYDLQSEQLAVTVKNCSGLPRSGTSSAASLDPYLTIRIAHQKQQGEQHQQRDEHLVQSTPTVRNSTSPEFNYVASFPVPKAILGQIKVLLEIYDWSSAKNHPMVARHAHAIGDGNDLLSSEGLEFERQLKRGHRVPDTGPGDICVQLQQGPQPEVLTVRVIECKGVYLRDSRGKVDNSTLPSTYVEVTLTEPHGGSIHNRRTETISKERNPYYNEEFKFDSVPPETPLRQCVLRLTLVHVSSFLRTSQAVGSVELCADDDSDEDINRLAKEHWLAVTQQPPGSDEQSMGAAKCSWHCLVSPDEERRLRTASAFRGQKRLRGKMMKEEDEMTTREK